jgi:hypothetical protein
MDRADEVMRTRRLPPAVQQWAGSIRLSEAPTSEPGFRSYKLRRHRALYERVATQLLRDGFFELATKGGPMGLWVERFDDGTGVFGYLYFTSSGMTRLAGANFEPAHIARAVEFALLDSRLHPLPQQPSLRDSAE